MSGKQYQVFMAPSARRRYRKFDPVLKQTIKEEAKKLSENPHIHEERYQILSFQLWQDTISDCISNPRRQKGN